MQRKHLAVCRLRIVYLHFLLIRYSSAKQVIDKAAASRFIKHAIAQASRQQQEHPIVEHATPAEVTAEPTPVKITQKMVERAEYERHLRESDTDDEGPDLEIFEEPRQDDDVNDAPAQMPATTSYKGKGKMQDPGVSQAPAFSSLKKRRRPEMDPFDGISLLLTLLVRNIK